MDSLPRKSVEVDAVRQLECREQCHGPLLSPFQQIGHDFPLAKITIK